jgi:hypothetical protein
LEKLIGTGGLYTCPNGEKLKLFDMIKRLEECPAFVALRLGVLIGTPKNF